MTGKLPNSLFRTVGTYLGVPQTLDLTGAKAAVIGLPFDCGRHPRRVGARLGPAAIRYMSTDMVRHYRPDDPGDFDPVRALGLVDCGDVPVVSAEVESSVETMAEAISAVVERGVVPICMGGDGVISLPQMQALSRKYPDLCVLHFDSHTDAYPEAGNESEINPATTFAYAVQKGYVDAGRSIHFGLRGFTYVPRVFDYTQGLGYQTIPIEALESEGIAGLAKRFKETVGDRPVFLCFDMDFFDPSAAPGVFTPAWGGATAREGLALLRALKGINFVGFDVNTLTPGADLKGQTAWLAATVMLEFCYLACDSLGLTPKGEAAY